MSNDLSNTHVVVLGAGPGGYAAAFKAADLGMTVSLVDLETNPGGVCLYRGCIPSKALLHVAKLLNEAEEATNWGITFGKPRVFCRIQSGIHTGQDGELSARWHWQITFVTKASHIISVCCCHIINHFTHLDTPLVLSWFITYDFQGKVYC